MRNLKAPAVAVTRGAVLLLTDDYALNLRLFQSTEGGEKKKSYFSPHHTSKVERTIKWASDKATMEQPGATLWRPTGADSGPLCTLWQ